MLQFKNEFYNDFFDELIDTKLIFDSDHYQYYNKDDDNVKDLFIETELVNNNKTKKDIITYLFTRGGCFIFARILSKYLNNKKIIHGILLLMDYEKDDISEYYDIEHAVVFYDNNLFDIEGNVTNNILNNHFYLDNNSYRNFLFINEHEKFINDNIKKMSYQVIYDLNGIKYYNELFDIEFLYETGDFNSKEKELKDILFKLFDKYLII